METITTTKPSSLTDQELDVFHQQSKEWLSEIDFWRDEAAFFYSLISKEIFKPIPIDAKSSYEKIEKELKNITVSEFEKLEQAIEQHETMLNKLIINKKNEELNFRKKHHQLALTISRYELHFKTLKKDVFSLVKMIAREKNN